MDPEEIRALMRRALADTASPAEKAQLHVLLRAQPRLGEELERLAIESVPGADDPITDRALAEGVEVHDNTTIDTHSLEEAILKRIPRGRLFSLRNFALAGGALAASVLLLVALNLQTGVEHPPDTGADGGSSSVLNSESGTVLDLGNGLKGHLQETTYKLADGLTLTAHAGSLLTLDEEKLSVYLVGGSASVEVSSADQPSIQLNNGEELQIGRKADEDSSLAMVILSVAGRDWTADILTREEAKPIFKGWLMTSRISQVNVKVVEGVGLYRSRGWEWLMRPGCQPRPVLTARRDHGMIPTRYRKGEFEGAFSRYERGGKKDGVLKGREVSDELLARHDLDKNDEISRDEYVLTRQIESLVDEFALHKLPADDARLLCDTNQNGVIEAEEITRVLKPQLRRLMPQLKWLPGIPGSRKLPDGEGERKPAERKPRGARRGGMGQR